MAAPSFSCGLVVGDRQGGARLRFAGLRGRAAPSFVVHASSAMLRFVLYWCVWLASGFCPVCLWVQAFVAGLGRDSGTLALLSRQMEAASNNNSLTTFSCCLSQSLPTHHQQPQQGTPVVSKEIQEVPRSAKVLALQPPNPGRGYYHQHHGYGVTRSSFGEESGKEMGTTRSSLSSSKSSIYFEQQQLNQNRMAELGWGRWYSLEELDMATNGFCEENKVGEGGYGVVFRGYLADETVVTVKNLLNNA